VALPLERGERTAGARRESEERAFGQFGQNGGKKNLVFVTLTYLR